MRVYISSTFEDLKDYRRAVYDQLRKLRLDTIAMEDYVASEQRPLAQCVADVAGADLYIGIFAWRYGYIPQEDNPEKKSITELEYRAAGHNSKERLIFMLREDAPWSPKLMDSHQQPDKGTNIAQLREFLRTKHGIVFFSNPDELASQVSAAVATILLRETSDLQRQEQRPRSPPPRRVPQRRGAEPLQKTFNELQRGLTLQSYERGLAAAQSIAVICNVLGERLATGFLVKGTSLHPRFGNELFFVTAAHIIIPERSVNSFGLPFEEARISLTSSSEAQPREYLLAGIAWYSPVDRLDISVCRITEPLPVAGLDIADIVPVINPEARAYVVGHPRGGALFFCLDGVLFDSDDVALQYDAYTAAGSGGSPVFNSQWEVIGVHRLSGEVPRLTGEGKIRTCQAVALPAIKRELKNEFG